MLMEITFTYILSQIFTAAEYGLLGASYFVKRRLAVILLDLFSMAAGIVAYILLGADIGLAMSVVIFLANFYYLYDEKKQGKNHALQTRDYVALVIIMLAIAGLAVWTYDGPLSLLSVAATVLYEISIWQNSTKVYKFLGIPVALCWVLYNAFVFSVVGILSESIILIAAIVGFFRAVWLEKRQKKQRKQKKLKVRANNSSKTRNHK